MRDRSRIIAGFVVIATALPAWRASFAAPQDRYRLAWHPVGACPTDNDVRARINHILGSISSSGDVLDAVVDVITDGSTYRAHVKLTAKGETSTREVDGDSCNAVADATALIVAIAIDPNAIKNAPAATTSTSTSTSTATSTSTPTSGSTANPNPSAKPSPTAPPNPTATASSPKNPEPPIALPYKAPPPSDYPPPYVFLDAGYVFDSSTLPGVASGAVADVGWRAWFASLSVTGFWLAARDTHLDAKPSEGAGVGAFGLGARGCYELVNDRPFDLSPCAGADVVWLSAGGFGSSSPSDASARLFRLTLAGRFTYRIWRFGLFAEAGAAIPLTRPQFVIENSGTVERIAPASFVGKIGAAFHF